MRVKLEIGAIVSQDENRGIGVYARELSRRLPQLVEVVEQNQDITHRLVFKIFSPLPLVPPSVVTVHDLIPLKYPQAYPPGIRGRLKWWQNKKILRQANGIITDSQASKKDIISLTGVEPNKIFVVYLAAAEIFKPLKAVNQWG